MGADPQTTKRHLLVDKLEDLSAVDQAIQAAGWYEYFDHSNLATELQGRDGVGAADALCTLLGVD